MIKLQDENSTLKEEKLFMERTNKRLEDLERSHYLNLQYDLRDSVEITGIPTNIPDNGLEDEVIKIFDRAKVEVNGTKLDKLQIQGCHRIGKMGKIILKTVNQKLATESLFCSKNLKGNSPYQNDVYFNNSFCKEFSRSNFLVRKAKRVNVINWWKVNNGVTYIMLVEDGTFLEISHFNDLVLHGIVHESI